MKKPTAHLFQMIRSLTPAEKRYFKIYASKHVIGSKNNYEKLFDALDNWEAEYYDEALFLKANARQPYAKYFADEKKHLEELLFEAMRNYNGSKSISGRLNDMLTDERFCRDKRLNELRLKIIARAKELAYKYERWGTLLELLDREATAVLEIKQEDLLKTPLQIEAEAAKVLQWHNQAILMQSRANLIFSLLRAHTGIATAKIIEQADKLVNVDVVCGYSPGAHFVTDTLYYRIYFRYYRLTGQMQKAHQAITNLLECYNTHAHFKDENPQSYKIALFNFLNSCHNVRNYSLFEEVLDKAAAIAPATPDDEGEDWQNMVHLRLLYYLGTSRFTDALAMGAAIQKGLKQYAHKVNAARRLTLYYNLFSAAFVLREWSKCIDYLNNIVNDPTSARQDLKLLAEIMLPVVHHEQGNFTLVDYTLQNLKRRLPKTKLPGAGDLQFIKLLEKMNKSVDGTKVKVQQQMLHLIQQGQQMPLLKDEEILKLWLNGRLNKC